MKVLKLYTDGAARGNPGPAGHRRRVDRRGGERPGGGRRADRRGDEQRRGYAALLRGLEIAGRHGPDRLLAHSDSQLIVHQVNGVYRVKTDHLRDSHSQAVALLARFPSKQLIHIPPVAERAGGPPRGLGGGRQEAEAPSLRESAEEAGGYSEETAEEEVSPIVEPGSAFRVSSTSSSTRSPRPFSFPREPSRDLNRFSASS